MKILHDLMRRVARLERISKEDCIEAHDVFFDNPLKKSVKEFAESGAISNSPEIAGASIKESDSPDRSLSKAKSEAIIAPPTPQEIEKNPGGTEFSTLNQLVINTEEKVRGVPKGFEEAPKVDPDEPLPSSEKGLRQIKKETLKKVMRRKGYVGRP